MKSDTILPALGWRIFPSNPHAQEVLCARQLCGGLGMNVSTAASDNVMSRDEQTLCANVGLLEKSNNEASFSAEKQKKANRNHRGDCNGFH